MYINNKSQVSTSTVDESASLVPHLLILILGDSISLANPLLLST